MNEPRATPSTLQDAINILAPFGLHYNCSLRMAIAQALTNAFEDGMQAGVFTERVRVGLGAEEGDRT